MRLKRKPPKGRSLERLKSHYLAEKAIALRLKNSTREERKSLYSQIYVELFSKVDDHPRLQERKDHEKTKVDNERKYQLVSRFLSPSAIFVEFAPGDGHFASYVAERVKKVYAIDISDQRSPRLNAPGNFQFVLYNGFDLDFPRDSVDFVFSDQLLEHLHPDDVNGHLALIRSILREGGLYLFRTPHAFFGPHDISGYFSVVPEGLHLQEWTFSQIFRALKESGYSSGQGYWKILKGLNHRYLQTPPGYFILVECVLGQLPKRAQRALGKLFLPRHVVIIARK